jgi:hypothetical protein
VTYALTRQEWMPAAPLVGVMTLPARGVFVHHSVTRQTEPAFSAVRTIERIGIARFGRMSYSAVGHRDVLIEGAGDSIGAHTGGFAAPGVSWNRVSYGYCFVGNYDNDQLTDKQISDFGRWCRWAVNTGRLVPGFALRPHRDVKSTACPGRNVLFRWPDLVNAAHQEDDDMAVTHRVGKDRSGRWWSFKSTDQVGVEWTQQTADTWWALGARDVFTNNPDEIELLKASSTLAPLGGR